MKSKASIILIIEIYGKIASRLRAIAFYASHETVEEIEERLGYCRQTICEWIHRYNDKGLNGNRIISILRIFYANSILSSCLD